MKLKEGVLSTLIISPYNNNKIIAKRLVNNEIEKVKRVGLATLKDFCELHETDITGTSVSEIINGERGNLK